MKANLKTFFLKSSSVLINLIVSFLTLIIIICLLEIALQKIKTSEYSVIEKDWFKKNVRLNSLGYRDFQYSQERPKNTFRVLMLGDSMTFGSGINKISDTYPKQLEVLLNKGSKQKFEVINTAYPGYNTDSQLYDLYIKGFNLQPDMVFLGYYHNDIPKLSYLRCDPTSREIIKKGGKIRTFVDKTVLYQFINFRYNRLLEKLNHKPKMEDCINEAYSSTAWEMEKVYLDAIRKACMLRNIKLMIGIIPLMYKLNDNYPIKMIQSKLKSYCTENGVECIDFFEEGFVGKNALKLVISPEDRHLNSQGAKIISKSLFEKLKPLTTFNNLSDIHRIFSIQDLLTDNELAHKIDEAYGEIKEKTQSPKNVFPVSDEKNQIKIDFEKSWEKNEFTLTRRYVSQQIETKSRFTLDTRGRFIDHTLTTYSLNSKSELSMDRAEKVNNQILVTHFNRQSGGKKLYKKINFKLSGKKTLDGNREIYIKEGIPFYNPKTLISKLLIIPSSVQENDQLEILIENRLLFFHRNHWGEFMDAMIKDIIKENPSPIILRSIARTYKTTKELKKLETIKKLTASASEPS